MSGGGEARGIVFRVDGKLAFLPATIAVRIAPVPRVTRVPGAPEELLGVALHEGEILPLIALGAERSAMVVCSHHGELLGLVTGEVVATGAFPARPHVEHEGVLARPLDLEPIYARVQAGGWSARWR